MPAKVDIPRLVTAYYEEKPNAREPSERVAFGTSGHRGSSLARSFNEDHILATTQAICEIRKAEGIEGPLFLGADTHALSEPARATALEVLAAHSVEVMIDQELGYTPTPVISHAVLGHNAKRGEGRADGIVITPSHNPPEDGGFKYNPPHGGPADTSVTSRIEQRANAILEEGAARVPRHTYARALKAATTHRHDFVRGYVSELDEVVDMDKVRNVELGVDPLGGAGVAYWGPIAERYRLRLEVVNPEVDPTFAFMPPDWDGTIRMDCSSPHAMAGLIGLKDRFDVAFANDTDNDRHGIVTRSAGLMNPNHYLAAAIAYLFTHRPGWHDEAAIGKTLVTSAIVDRLAVKLGRKLFEVPVGFKWFVDGLLDGSLGFGGEESAGASFVRRDGTVWTTDKDGILLGLLAAEMTAVEGRDPSEQYKAIASELGAPVYERVDSKATREEKAILKKLSPQDVDATSLAGDPIVAVLSEAPGNGAAVGGVKVVTEYGWFAARPSGTEDVYKLYAESFRDRAHLERIQDEARALLSRVLAR